MSTIIANAKVQPAGDDDDVVAEGSEDGYLEKEEPPAYDTLQDTLPDAMLY